MQLKFSAAVAGCILAAGCATQDQLRQSEVQSAEQKEAVQALRADAGRSESSIAELRAEVKRAQDAIHGLEIALADARARADAARLQADTAVATSRDFLSSLVAAREEQRRQLAESSAAFAEIRRKLADTQQSILEQTGSAMAAANRRLLAAETGLAEAGRRTAALEAGSKSGKESDKALTDQLQVLRSQIEETRSVISSEGLLGLMRDLQSVQRDTAVLRGLLEELQHAQIEATGRVRNQYLDLDTRIRTLKQRISQQAAQEASTPPAGAAADAGGAVPLPAVSAAETALPVQESDPSGAADSSPQQAVPVAPQTGTEGEVEGEAVPLPEAVSQ